MWSSKVYDKDTKIVNDANGDALEFMSLAGRLRLPVQNPPFEIPGMLERWSDTQDFVLGWPARCLWFESTREMHGCILSPRKVLHKIDFKRSWLGLAPRSRFVDMAEGLPTGVLWPGLLINTATYSGAWLAVFVVPMQIRRRMAVRTGQCGKCRYDLRGLNPGSPCPECGNPR